jgi:hypothetical protein
MNKVRSSAKTPRWVCSECGMGSSRKDTVLRHMTLHPGDGILVSYMQYLTGVHDGTYSEPTYPFQTTRASSRKKNIEFARRHGIIIPLSQLINTDGLHRADRFIGDVIAGYHERDALRIMGARYLGQDRALKEIISGSKHDPSFPKVRGFKGSVCPKCLGICISEYLQDAGAIRLRVREHKCILKHWIDVPGQFRTNEVSKYQLIDRLHNNELLEVMLSLISQIEKQTALQATIFFDRIGAKDIEVVTSPVVLNSSVFDPNSTWTIQILEKLKDGHLPDRSTISDFLGLSGMSTFVTIETRNMPGFSRSCNTGITFE